MLVIGIKMFGILAEHTIVNMDEENLEFEGDKAVSDVDSTQSR